MIEISQLYEKIHLDMAPLGLDVFCRKLVDLVLLSPVDNPSYTYSFLQNALDGCSLEELQKSLNYLKSSPISLFALQYQYIDAEGVPYDISRESLLAAFQDEALEHPQHSYLDPDYKSRVYVLHVADKSVIQL
ncbi:hypothetical protein MQC82_04565 [Pseudomonas viridiflava]|uniref:hypothetical protein n=1 Tax=Pseudomonas viridiflava TaxID=33069 RepID=UPI001F61457F|nr:hypothetical protein [Pseudomonas viridiflava]MCI3908832.1 hypothetical protein [Pseudomonas viridiflava]